MFLENKDFSRSDEGSFMMYEKMQPRMSNGYIDIGEYHKKVQIYIILDADAAKEIIRE